MRITDARLLVEMQDHGSVERLAVFLLERETVRRDLIAHFGIDALRRLVVDERALAVHVRNGVDQSGKTVSRRIDKFLGVQELHVVFHEPIQERVDPRADAFQ